ncbi:MAG: hypothetical protein WBD28_02825 [Candidatus Zixiibacteriota bacterium]
MSKKMIAILVLALIFVFASQAIAEEIGKFFIKPNRLNVGRSAGLSFNIHLFPIQPMNVSVGDPAEVFVDVDKSGTFDADEVYAATVHCTDVDGQANDIGVNVYCLDLEDNDPNVVIYSINGIPVSDTSGNDILLYLDTFVKKGSKKFKKSIPDPDPSSN